MGASHDDNFGSFPSYEEIHCELRLLGGLDTNLLANEHVPADDI